MTDAPTVDALHDQPVPAELGTVETTHAEPETPEQRLSTAVAETAASVTGVHHLGGVASRALDRASRRILGSSTVPGVTVSRANGRTIVDLDLVVEYPHTITEVLETVRKQVARVATQLVSEPVEVNVNVTDVHGPFDRVVPANEEIDPADSLAARASEAADTVRAKTSEAASTVAAAASSATDVAADALADAKDATSVAVSDAKDATADAVSRATEAAASAKDAASDAVSAATATGAVDVDETDLHESPVIVVVPVIVDAEDERSDSKDAPVAEPTEHTS